MVMARRDEQPPLWATVPAEELCQTFEDAREGWRVVRFRHVIGSPEEQAAWEAYRQASDAYMALLRRR